MPQDVAQDLLAFGAREAPSLPRHHRRRRRLCASRAEMGAQLSSSAAFVSSCGQALPGMPRKALLCLLDGRFYRKSPHPIRTSPESHSPTRKKNAHQIAEVFSPRTMAAADAGENPTRLSATPARVRAQFQMKGKQRDLENQRKRNEKRKFNFYF